VSSTQTKNGLGTYYFGTQTTENFLKNAPRGAPFRSAVLELNACMPVIVIICFLLQNINLTKRSPVKARHLVRILEYYCQFNNTVAHHATNCPNCCMLRRTIINIFTSCSFFFARRSDTHILIFINELLYRKEK